MRRFFLEAIAVSMSFALLVAPGSPSQAQTSGGSVITVSEPSKDNTTIPAETPSGEQAPAPGTSPESSPANDASDGQSDPTTVGPDGDTSPDAEKIPGEKELDIAAEPAQVPDIITDLSTIPFPVRKMRELIIEAAKSGDIEKLRPYIGYGDDVTMLSLGGFDEDPIDFLKSLSGDPEGHEILAILTEILEAPAVKIEERTGEEVYVWPYYYSYPYEKLTPEQRVQLFRIITYGDYEEMVNFGNYIFYRLGITPEGRWRFFVAGD